MRKRTSFFIFLFLSSLILFSFFSGCLFKPPVTEGVLKGQVIVPEGTLQAKDLTGQALPNATINIIDPVTGDIIATATTDANGYYQVFVPAGGPYLLEAVKDGVKVQQVTPQVEVGIEYNLGTADCATTSVALIAQAMLVAEDYPDNLADINLADIAADPDFNDVMSIVCSTIEAGGDPTELAVVQQAVEDFLYPPAPAPVQAATADLTGLALSGSPSNYTFASSTYTYNGVTVANAIASITVTPTGAGTITVDGTEVTSGSASGAIALTAGVEKTITVVAIETGKSAKTYTIKITRANPAQATPTFDPAAGAVAFPTNVTIISAGADAIYYTTNGSDPTTASINQATTPLIINSACTVKALAVKAGSDDSAIGSAAYTQATATAPSNIVLAVGSANPVGGVTNVAIPAAGGTDTTGAVTGWVTSTADKIKFTVTDSGAAVSTITIGGAAYTSGADYTIPSTSTLTIVVTTTEAGKSNAIRTFMVTVAAVTYTVTYDGNGNTAGTVPVDPASPYEDGAAVTVLGNTGDLIRINAGGTSYRFTYWNTKADGSGTAQTEGSTFTMGASNVILYAQWTPYVLRDTGPAGGLIFYDNGSYTVATHTVPAWRYLEAAPDDQSEGAKWGCHGTEIEGADGTAVGTGEQNTLDIVDIETGCATAGIAARLCTSYEGGGYTDWFLPSKEEINLMCTNLHLEGVGGFNAVQWYWSSSESTTLTPTIHVWIQHFGEERQEENSKDYTLRVRAIRAF